MKKQFTAVGFTCGVGSLLVGAQKAGFKVLGNIEWRKYYHYKDPEGRNTFTENFPGALWKNSINDLTDEELEMMTGADIALGHPDCGNYSILNQHKDRVKDPGDIPVFIELIQKLRPRFFVQDNLPKSLMGVSMLEWAEALPEYDLFPEWVSNYHYGNIQKSRKRFFMIGALKSEKFAFCPGEFEHNKTLAEVLEGVEGLPNQNPHVSSGPCGKVRMNTSGKKYGEKTDQFDPGGTWESFKKYFEDKPDGHVMLYVTKEGVIRRRMGTSKGYTNGHSHLLDGSSPLTNPMTNLPFTMRERCRIQGLPDDFVIVGEKLPYNHEKNTALIKQTGKCMPIQFGRYVSEQIYDHITGNLKYPWVPSRMIKPNPIIDDAKQWYCNNVGYSNQEAACAFCWIKPGCQMALMKDM